MSLLTTEHPARAETMQVVDPIPVRSAGAHVKISSLSKSYGERAVLQALDFETGAGECVAVVGRSGCGKSTLLRLLAGLDQPETGEVRINGVSVQPADPRVRVMFQESRLLPWKRVIDNVRLGLAAGDRTVAESRLRCVGLEDRGRDWPLALSGGQQQRVALARALAARPEVLLLDEPLGALDALTRLEMQALIERLWREAAFTLILITHDVDEAVALADRVYVMADGNWSAIIPVNLPRPRERAHPHFIRLRESVLAAVLEKNAAPRGHPGPDMGGQI